MHSGEGNGFHTSVCFFKTQVLKQNSCEFPSKSGGSVRFGRWNRQLWHEVQLERDLAGKGGDSGRRDVEGKESDTASVLQASSFPSDAYVATNLNLMFHSLLTKWIGCWLTNRKLLIVLRLSRCWNNWDEHKYLESSRVCFFFFTIKPSSYSFLVFCKEINVTQSQFFYSEDLL